MTLRTGKRQNAESNRAGGGFTLIELMLVMAMLLIVLSVAFPSLKTFFQGRTLDSEARRFLSLTRYGQSRAISEGMPMDLWIDTDQRLYGLRAATGFVDSDTKQVAYTLAENLEVEVSQPVGRFTSTQLKQVAALGKNVRAIRFLTDGSIGETSPDSVMFRQKEGDRIRVVESANRLKYEVQDDPNDRR
jgi:type II secretion system protein H